MELALLRSLQFTINLETVHSFVLLFARETEVSPIEAHLAYYFANDSLCSACNLFFPPTTIACACLCLAMEFYSKPLQFNSSNGIPSQYSSIGNSLTLQNINHTPYHSNLFEPDSGMKIGSKLRLTPETLPRYFDCTRFDVDMAKSLILKLYSDEMSVPLILSRPPNPAFLSTEDGNEISGSEASQSVASNNTQANTTSQHIASKDGNDEGNSEEPGKNHPDLQVSTSSTFRRFQASTPLNVSELLKKRNFDSISQYLHVITKGNDIMSISDMLRDAPPEHIFDEIVTLDEDDNVVSYKKSRTSSKLKK